MANWHYFVATFSESSADVFAFVKNTWELFSYDDGKKGPAKLDNFVIPMPLEPQMTLVTHKTNPHFRGVTEPKLYEYGIQVQGAIREVQGSTELKLFNLTSDDWIRTNREKIVEFCLKYKPARAYIYHQRSPKITFFTKEKGLLIDLRKHNPLKDL